MRRESIAWDLVTPEEAVKLSQLGTIEHISIAAKIAKESINHEIDEMIREDKEIRDFKWAQLKVWVTVWNAGRIAGIRAERMKGRRGIS